jgi:uncharacterized membrane protein
MKLWFILPLIATFLWASTNFIDKFLINKHFKGRQGALVLYSAFIGLPIFILIGLFNPEVLKINFITAILIILNSFLYVVYLIPYFRALSKADTSVVTPLFQIIPVFTYFLALFFLDEHLSLNQILGSILIIMGAVGISIRIKKKSFHLRKEVLGFMLLASLLVSLNWFFFKFFALELDFWKTSFWQYIGYTLFGLLLFSFKKSYRVDFINSFKKTKGKIIFLNALNESLNISAIIIFSYASLLAPLALVSVLNGVQPVFLLFMGIILSKFFPKIIKEDISKRVIIQKMILFILIIAGIYLINL